MVDIGTQLVETVENMIKFYENPHAPRKRQSSYDFAAPTKEQATTGRFMCAGDDYGVGFRQPSGKEKASGLEDGPIIMKSSCVDPNEL